MSKTTLMQLPAFIKEVEPYVNPRGRQYKKGLFKCSCGKEFKTVIANVKYKVTNSCGCLVSKKTSQINKTHGLSNHSLYKVWDSVIQRCYNPKCLAYARYGGRGITMDNTWKNSFQQFYNDLISQWKPELQIDRIDNNKGYTFDNCRFVTAKINNRNKNNNVKVILNKKEVLLIDACSDYNMHYSTVYSRIKRGWDVEKALSIPMIIQHKTIKNATV